MAYDEYLADRIRAAVAETPDVVERRMFGGLAFLVARHMACGIVGNDLRLRFGEDGADAALDEPHSRPMDFTGKPMKSMSTPHRAGLRRMGRCSPGWNERPRT
jgi:TfoX/Sxy family transcriptional regulator of competence genes